MKRLRKMLSHVQKLPCYTCIAIYYIRAAIAYVRVLRMKDVVRFSQMLLANAQLTFLRLWLCPPEPSEFGIHTTALVNGLFLLACPSVIRTGPLFRIMYSMYPAVYPWGWFYLIAGMFGMLALFIRCYYPIRLMAAFSQVYLSMWVAGLILVAQWTGTRKEVPWIIVYFGMVLLFAAYTMVRLTFAMPRFRIGYERWQELRFQHELRLQHGTE